MYCANVVFKYKVDFWDPPAWISYKGDNYTDGGLCCIHGTLNKLPYFTDWAYSLGVF